MGTDIFKYKIIRNKKIINEMVNIYKLEHSLNPPDTPTEDSEYSILLLNEYVNLYNNKEYKLNYVGFEKWLIENNVPIIDIPIAVFDSRKFFEIELNRNIDDFEEILFGNYYSDIENKYKDKYNIIFNNQNDITDFITVYKNKYNKEIVILSYSDNVYDNLYYFYEVNRGIAIEEVNYQRRQILNPHKLVKYKKFIYTEEDFNFVKEFFVEENVPMKKWKLNKDEFVYISE